MALSELLQDSSDRALKARVQRSDQQNRGVLRGSVVASAADEVTVNISGGGSVTGKHLGTAAIAAGESVVVFWPKGSIKPYIRGKSAV